MIVYRVNFDSNNKEIFSSRKIIQNVDYRRKFNRQEWHVWLEGPCLYASPKPADPIYIALKFVPESSAETTALLRHIPRNSEGKGRVS